LNEESIETSAVNSCGCPHTDRQRDRQARAFMWSGDHVPMSFIIPLDMIVLMSQRLGWVGLPWIERIPNIAYSGFLLVRILRWGFMLQHDTLLLCQRKFECRIQEVPCTEKTGGEYACGDERSEHQTRGCRNASDADAGLNSNGSLKFVILLSHGLYANAHGRIKLYTLHFRL